MKMKKQYLTQALSVAVLFVFAASMAMIVRGVPTDPIGATELRVENTTRMNTSYLNTSTYAEAGNITMLTMNFTSVTMSWQGFFGNISGRLILDDAQNFTFYDWEMHEPRGEVYASERNNVIWVNITCFNFYASVDVLQEQVENLSTLERRFGIADYDDDGINETFNRSVHPEFFVGTVNITNNTCRSTNTYVNDTYNGVDYFETVLYDNTTNSTVFATIIEDRSELVKSGDKFGYNNETNDFQMLVLEDGHSGPSQDSPTLYYFWAELQ